MANGDDKQPEKKADAADDGKQNARPGGKRKRKEAKQSSEKEAGRREQVIKIMQENGFPMAEESVIDFMSSYYDAMEKTYRAVGRPTKYFPELCTWVEWLGARGYSNKQIAVFLGISEETLYEWARNNDEFSESLLRARAGAQSWWETVGQSALFANRFQFGVWNKIISSRFRRDYTDQKGLPFDPKAEDNEIVVNETVDIDPRLLTAEEREVVEAVFEKIKKQETE